MKFLLKRLIFGVSLTVALVACKKDNNTVTPGGSSDDPVAVQVKATVGGLTKMHDAVWDENDAIGLAMLDDDGHAVINDVYNYHYITATNEGIFTPRSPEMAVYFPQDGTPVSFRAYYPYYPSLDTEMEVPLSTVDQTVLPEIDFLSADVVRGKSKIDPVVHLIFHHRLSMLVFDFQTEDGNTVVPVEDLTVTVQGMETRGIYHLLNEALDVDETTTMDMEFPLRDDPEQRYGIVLPRPAGEGVTFEFKGSDGSVYTAKMADDLELKQGYKYTFKVNLNETPVSLSAEIEPWIDGPVTNYDALRVSEKPGVTAGFEPGDEMEVYLKNATSGDYSPLATYTYQTDGSWEPESTVYWEDIPGTSADLRASSIAADALNNTQLPDILLADDVNVQKYGSARFTFRHALSKAIVTLGSDTFTDEELATATITLPDYLTGGYQENGSFIPGTDRAAISLVTNEDGERIGIFQPQSVGVGDALVNVVLNGETYTATVNNTDFIYNAGEAKLIRINLNKVGVTVSATVVDWNYTRAEFDILSVSTPAGNTTGIEAGNQMKVYAQQSGAYSQIGSFTYNADGTWLPDATIYWEDLEGNPVPLRASIIREEELNATQMPDILIADDINANRNEGVNFTFRHALSKLVVTLESDTFTPTELAGATLTLPGYTTGGDEELGQFVPGTQTTTVRVQRGDENIAIIQPQTIADGKPVIVVTINGRDYTANAGTGGFIYNPGEAKQLNVVLNKEEITVSARVIDWTTTTVELTAVTPGSVTDGATGVRNGEVLNLYYSTDGVTRLPVTNYTYNQAGNSWTANPPVYWESLPQQVTFYGSILRTAKYNDTQLDDYLVATPVPAQASYGFDMTLAHAASRVVVQLKSTDFDDVELARMNINLPNYDKGGEVVNGVFVPGIDNGLITVAKGVGDNNDQAMAFIQPQTVNKGDLVAQIVNPVTNRTYDVRYDADVIYRPNFSTILVINISKTGVTLNARVVDWEDGGNIPMNATTIKLDGTLNGNSDFFENQTIHVYKLDGNNANEQNLTYSYLLGSLGYQWKASENLYWDDMIGEDLSMTGAFFPSVGGIPTVNIGDTYFDWDLPHNQNQLGWANYDVLTSHVDYSTPSYVNFLFRHATSKVIVRLTSDEFTHAELQGAGITFNSVILDGRVSLADGILTSTGAGKTMVPYTTTAGTEYTGLVMPGQTFNKGDQILTITLDAYPGVNFYGAIQQDLTLEAGFEHIITVKLSRTAIELNARVQNWQDGDDGTIEIS